jgi:hypothetical protein
LVPRDDRSAFFREIAVLRTAAIWRARCSGFLRRAVAGARRFSTMNTLADRPPRRRALAWSVVLGVLTLLAAIAIAVPLYRI